MDKKTFNQLKKFLSPKVEALADKTCDPLQLSAFMKVEKLLFKAKNRGDFLWNIIEKSTVNHELNYDNINMTFVSNMFDTTYDLEALEKEFKNIKFTKEELNDWNSYKKSYYKAFMVTLLDSMNEKAKEEPPPEEINKVLPAFVKLDKSYKFLTGIPAFSQEEMEYWKENIPFAEIPSKGSETYKKLEHALINKDIKTFLTYLNSILASIPYSIKKEKEGYLHSNIHAILKAFEFDIVSEEATNNGRIDAVIRFPNIIYIFEFKNGTGEEAMKQIKKKKYYEKFLIEGKDIMLVGVGFDFGTKNIKDDYKVKEIPLTR